MTQLRKISDLTRLYSRKMEKHPDLQMLKLFRKGEYPELKEHITQCEICQSIIDGLAFAEKEEKPLGDIVATSKAKVWNQVKPKNRSLWYWYAAASVVLLVTLLTVLNIDSDPEEIISSEIAAIYESPIMLRSGQIQVNPWDVFIQLYSNQEFDQALIAIDTIVSKSSEMIFYSGLCHLYKQSPNYAEALASFNQVYYSTSRFKDDAVWYQALCYLKLGDTMKARASLEVVSDNSNHPKRQQATELLAALK